MAQGPCYVGAFSARRDLRGEATHKASPLLRGRTRGTDGADSSPAPPLRPTRVASFSWRRSAWPQLIRSLVWMAVPLHHPYGHPSPRGTRPSPSHRSFPRRACRSPASHGVALTMRACMIRLRRLYMQRTPAGLMHQTGQALCITPIMSHEGASSATVRIFHFCYPTYVLSTHRHPAVFVLRAQVSVILRQ